MDNMVKLIADELVEACKGLKREFRPEAAAM